ncbi:hypothetical protein V1525DRAFT_387727 [Lipomyces kononenkoae]|uniref:Uncharacterized protein n=1 Tax=Lipomyces kononenkoae TaxID=34357 RepID=A0ACC3T378_LIPKO
MTRELTTVAPERASKNPSFGVFKNLLRRKATDKKVPLHCPFSSASDLNQWKRFRGWVHRKTHREKEERASGVDVSEVVKTTAEARSLGSVSETLECFTAAADALWKPIVEHREKTWS